MKYQIKKKTLLSVVSVMLCLVLLAGTAYAYFEYKVTNYGNKITIGGIAVDLLKYDETNTQYQSVSNGTEGIFNDATMNAGDTKIVFLQVKNTGTLDLYYDLVLNATIKDTSGTESTADISNVLKYATVADKQAPTSPEMTWTDFTSATGVVSGENKPVTGKALTVSNSDYLVLAVNLDASAGDTYAGYSIEIDAEVVATQEAPTNPDAGEGDSGNEGSGSEGSGDSGDEGNNEGQIVDLMNGAGDFDDGVTLDITSTSGDATWVLFKTDGANSPATIIEDSANAKSGTRYLYVNGTEDSAATTQIITKDGMSLTSGKNYIIEFWIKTSEGKPLVTVYSYDSLGSRTKLKDIQNVSNGEWAKTTDSFTVPEGSSEVKIRIHGQKETAVFSIDGMKIYETPAEN